MKKDNENLTSFGPLENLEGQVAVVVGAGGGIGFAISKKLAQCGALIIGIVRNNAEELQNEFNQFDNNEIGHKIILADNTKTEELKEAIKDITQCDILVNTAGFSKTIPHKDIEELTDDFFDLPGFRHLASAFPQRTAHASPRAGDGHLSGAGRSHHGRTGAADQPARLAV